MSESSILDGLLEPLSRCLDEESARRIAAFEVSAQVQRRVDQLARAANAGGLNDDERTEYESLVNAADFIAILKLKARKQLAAVGA